MMYTISVAIIYTLLLVVCLLGIGVYVLNKFRFKFYGLIEKSLFAIGIGYTIITNVLLLLGLLNTINQISVTLVFIASLLFAIIVLYKEFNELSFDYFSFTRLKLNPSVLIGLLIIFALINFIGALAPPTLADSMNHHLAAPKYYARLGGFPFIPISPWPAPGLFHVLYTQTMLIANGVACQLIGFVFGIFSMLTVFAITRYHYGSMTGLISALIFYSLPITVELSTGAMPEMGATFCIILSIWALLKAVHKYDTHWIVLAGIMGGTAGATKLWALMGGPATILIIILLFGKYIFNKPLAFFRVLVIYSLTYGLILLPWFARNYFASGNPLWPIGFSIFETKYWSELSVIKYSGWSRGPGTSLLHYLIGPWNLTNNIAAFNAGYGIFTPYFLNPLLLAFIPSIYLFRNKFTLITKHLLSALGIFCFTVYTIWFLGGYHHPRYLQIIHPFLSIIAGIGIVTVLKHIRGYHKIIVYGFFGFISIFFLATTFVINLKYFPVVFGYIKPESYIENNVSHFEGVQWVNNNLSDNSKVLYCGTAAWYYMDIDYLPLAFRYIDYNSFNSSGELKNTLNELGITHILIDGDPEDGGATLQDIGTNEIKHIRDLNLHSNTDINNWLTRKREVMSIDDQIDYQTLRPFVLMRGMELNGNLSLIKLIKTKVITSRTKATYRKSEVSVYEIH